ncbi:hypothetical protein GMORB2_7484 [Geosmithia morbida]|uniref:Uncharacterized protein n=1 Tax=Geosmithia morbida TaxID=1094350 RepID=A0A9P5D190_9HYPO|nr:uncharacterized protein GMORB2_7484 [Geosmithia morbida]KAF4122492.1 hypothetical protein GMORB2_7484 [Geosmithia morbida]
MGSSLRLTLLILSALVSATPYPKDALHDAGYSYLQLRDCDSYCGADNQLCCSGGSVCTTLSGDIATCVGSGGRAITTTWTETRTYTSTMMTDWDPAPEPTAGVDCVPKNTLQEACGSICCAGWQTCAYQGQCSAKPGYEAPSTVVVTSDGKTTTRYSAPYRVTGTTTVVTSGVPDEAPGTATATDTATSTGGDAGQATSTGDAFGVNGGGASNSGLSGGEIAGIVIGSLAGAALILLIMFCCIARGLWGVIFGGGKKKQSNDSQSYFSSGYSSRRQHSGWFGGLFGRGGGDSGRTSEKRHSGGGKWLGLAGLAAALFALLKLRKDKKPARRGPSRSSRSRSRYTDSSYYSYSDASSPLSSSSGRRTYQSRRTRDSRIPPSSYKSRSTRS